MRIVRFLTLAALTAGTRAAAQNPALPTATGGEIHGLVVDGASKAPISTAIVDVTGTAAATVAHAATGTDGSFRVAHLQPRRYRVRIHAIGYTPRPLPPIEIGPSTPSVDVGTVTLAAAVVVLQPLQVTGQKQDVELAPDRNIYVVGDMPTTRGGTSLAVVRRRPPG